MINEPAMERMAQRMAGEGGITICAKCEHLRAAGKSAPEWTWLCGARPRPLRFSFLTGKETGNPFEECRHVNTNGECPDYREGVNIMSPDKFEPEEPK